jgi:hypothetical protein
MPRPWRWKFSQVRKQQVLEIQMANPAMLGLSATKLRFFTAFYSLWKEFAMEITMFCNIIYK